MAQQAKKNNSTKNKKKSKAKSFFKYFFITTVSLILLCSVIAAGYLLAIIKSTEPLDVNKVLTLSQPSRVYDSNNEFMDDVVGKEQRIVIPITEMPENLKNAFVSIEDERFYTHSGIDIKRILGAVYTDVIKIITNKPGLHGASTITQQLLKNTILTNEVSIERKVKEMYLALELEKVLSKDEILEAYLNTIPLGGTVYGVEAAAEKYFSKHASELNLLECAYIAGVTQSPTYYNALTEASKKNPDRYLNRTKIVLSQMLKNEKISQQEYDQAIQDIDNGKLVFDPLEVTNGMNFEWFTRPVITQVKEDLKAKYKYTDDEVQQMIVNGGLKIYSTMDRNLQNSTQKILNDNSNFNVGNDKNATITSADGHYTYPALQAAATIMDYHTGQVKAIVGGRGDQPPRSINRAYYDLRPIGSAAKPLTVYSPAIEMKLVTPNTTIEDSKLSYQEAVLAGGKNTPYYPQNQDRRYHGSVTIRDAITNSYNVVAIKTELMVGKENGLKYGKEFGLTYNNNSASSITAIALGQFNNDPNDRDGGNPTTIAAAYGVFGNNGQYTEPILYTRVEDASGNVILENQPEVREVLSPQAAYIMHDLLKGPTYNGSAYSARVGNITTAGKTGTTTDNSDMWFAGYTPYLSAAVWIGYDNPSQIYSNSSGVTAGSLFGKIMAPAHEGLAARDIEMPSGVVKGQICIDSGKLATDLCSHDPRGSRVRTDLFIGNPNVSSYCDVHVKAKVNSANGKLANQNTPPGLVVERIFLNKDISPSSPDYKYKLPTEQDDTKPETIKPSQNNNNNNNDDDDDKDDDDDDDKDKNNKPNTSSPNNNSNDKPDKNTKPKN